MINTIYGLPKPVDRAGLLNIIHQLLKIEYKPNQPIIPGYAPIMEEQVALAQLIVDAIITTNSTDPDVVWNVVLEMQRRNDVNQKSNIPNENKYVASWGGK